MTRQEKRSAADIKGTPSNLVGIYDAAGKTCPLVSGALLAAQGKQESGFNAEAGSSAGAAGIAQFMPAAWQAWGNGGNVFNPADAIPAQARYLCELGNNVKRFGGDTEALALAAYNAGPAAVAKHRGIPPFKETRNYVASIKAMVS